MSSTYVDTSCLVAIALGEPGWEETAARLDGFDRLVASNLLEAELRAVLQREDRSQVADPLLAEITWILPPRPLSPEMRRVVANGYVRGPDLWHLACALFAVRQPDELTFATLDRRQADVARQLGFPILD